MIGVIDYGAGNLASIRFALERLGVDVEICSDPKLITAYSHLIFPGVGSFRIAMEELRKNGWIHSIKQHANQGRPLLGICLGMQLLFDIGNEHGLSEGLGLISGTVELMSPSPEFKVPHVGWNGIDHCYSHPIFKGVKNLVDFYFVHSFHCVADNKGDILATCNYGGDFVAAVAKENIVGMQFHPEKSQPAGLRVLKNFADWDGKC